MTNETNKPKINLKALLKSIGTIECREGDGKLSFLNTWGMFIELRKEIKKLRQENKKLKKQQHANDSLPYMAANTGIWSFKTCPSIDLAMGEMYKSQRDFLRSELEQSKPVALFKCAKTHNPSKNGVYLLICNYHSRLTQRFTYWNGREWQVIGCHEDVLAFTETDPQEIINSLNK